MKGDDTLLYQYMKALPNGLLFRYTSGIMIGNWNSASSYMMTWYEFLKTVR